MRRRMDPSTTARDRARFVRALERRDERAFNRLVLDHQDRVFNLCYRLLGSREEARDVAQEVFVTLFEKIHLFRGDASLSTWIYRVASNHAKNRIKYLARRHERARQSWDEMAVRPSDGRLSASVPRPDQELEGRRLERFLQRALATLDADQREAVVLRDIEGLSYEDIAEVVDVGLGTVKSRIHRGRKLLKEALDRFQGGEDPTAPPRGSEERGDDAPVVALEVRPVGGEAA
ncbi:MAG: sigma-70 family RNA polymerase sigma factor [Myxococcota bacterium]